MSEKKNWFKVSGRVPHKKLHWHKGGSGFDNESSEGRKNLFAVDLIFDLSTTERCPASFHVST
jgi:hypothetical protein